MSFENLVLSGPVFEDATKDLLQASMLDLNQKFNFKVERFVVMKHTGASL